MSDRITTAKDAWGQNLPDWVEALVTACDETSQNAVAARLGYSGAVISQVLRAKYPGDLERVKQAVRAELMREEVDCHALGTISLSACLGYRKQADSSGSYSSLAAQMRRACRRCPLHRKGGGDAPQG